MARNRGIARSRRGAGPRVLLYSPDSYGLGHFQRNLLIARSLVRAHPTLSILCVTGSPRSHSFLLPPRFDYLKLPSVTKDGEGRYRSWALSVSFQESVRLRTRLLREAVLGLRPDVVLADHAPLGMAGELASVLRTIRRRLPDTAVVLGLRDIVDEPERIRREWALPSYREGFEKLYDRILVYGSERIFDLPREYGLPEPARRKVRFMGYLASEVPRNGRSRVRRELGIGSRPLVLGMAGGGGDGAPLFRTFLRALEIGAPPCFDSLLLAGPLLDPANRTLLHAAAGARSDLRVLDFVSNVPDLIRAADVVVSMAGYNSACEILACRAPAILVPRVHPRSEQFVRASRLAALGLVRLLHPEGLRPEDLRSAIEEALRHPPAPRSDLVHFDGAQRVAAEVLAMLNGCGHVAAAFPASGASREDHP
jgi:predicted glycosyltransferase